MSMFVYFVPPVPSPVSHCLAFSPKPLGPAAERRDLPPATCLLRPRVRLGRLGPASVTVHRVHCRKTLIFPFWWAHTLITSGGAKGGC